MPPANRQAYNAEHYRRNRDKMLAYANARNAAVRPTIRAFLDDYKSKNPCVDCGESDPIVLDFDHVDGKSFGISTAYNRSMTLARIEAEIARCEIRCANCHRRKTASRKQDGVFVQASHQG